MTKYFYLLLSMCIVMSFTSCEDDDDITLLTSQDEVKADYADLVLSNYEAARADAVTLDAAIAAFIADPTATTQQAAKDAWLAARESYGPTEAYRFANGPIDVIDGEEGPEGLLNSWPLDEAYIDYVDDDSDAGLINSPALLPTITKDALADLNGQGGEENVSVGYHAIEFLLWGQDLTAPSALEAGQRSFTDFVDGGTADNQDRRRAYLKACSELLLDHLQILIDQWAVGGPYRTAFLAQDDATSLSDMMTAIATLSKSELAGERVFVAYDNRDQEDEHSCFSDNTHRDLRLNYDGIRDVYLARAINDVEGASIADLILEADPVLAGEIFAHLEAAELAVYETAIPFDYAISDDSTRPNVLAAVTALRALGDKIVEGGDAIGIEVRIE
ncbi:imelysin family protein [Neolewinella aurantiaca]|nr:imelysin family protein [Neolewinella aurantiaca]